MRYKEVHSIRAAREKIEELEDRIERTRDIIKTEKDAEFVKSLVSTRNRRIGQFKRHINFFIADIKNMENINKLSNENIY